MKKLVNNGGEMEEEIKNENYEKEKLRKQWMEKKNQVRKARNKTLRNASKMTGRIKKKEKSWKNNKCKIQIQNK